MAAVTHHVPVSRHTGWLRPLIGSWPETACRLLLQEAEIVRVLIADVRGSAPREPGVCMLVTRRDAEGTIGGGYLEWQATAAARALLASGQSSPPIQIHRWVLGTQLGQCCGGVVQLWLERLDRLDLPVLRRAARIIGKGEHIIIETHSDGGRVSRRVLRSDVPATARPAHSKVRVRESTSGCATLLEQLRPDTSPLCLYGAGHVGQALVKLLAELPFDVTWIDSRAEQLPHAVPLNVRPLHMTEPIHEARTALPNARHLVMTHDHALDYALCREILARGEFAWLGLIGSASKGARFRSRLRRDGLPPERIDKLVCPIGVEGIASKSPAAIAIAVAAQLLKQLGPHTATHARSSSTGAVDCSARDCSSCHTTHGAPR